MKGWVYIISNPAMPGLVKVGHSTKDPELRARELNNTGTPHPYTVEYEMLIEDPFRVEQQTHNALTSLREGREWFRCSCEEAIAAIQRVAAGRAINETFRRADREQAEKIRKEQEDAESRQKLVNARIGTQELDVQSKYKDMFASQFPPRPFWQYWIGCSIGVLILIVVFYPKMSDSGGILLTGIGGAVVAAFVKEYFESKRKQSPGYKALIQERESKLKEARAEIIVLCPNQSCQKRIRFDVNKLVLSGNGMWSCPNCKTAVNPLQA